jgi:ribosomal protein S18 acetylase RimI-like enzyme
MWNYLLLCILISKGDAWISPSFVSLSQQSRRTAPFPSSAASSSDDHSTISIRTADYSELNPVSDIILQSFYDEIHKGPWKRIYKLAELNRLQQNFPYEDTDLHQMLVAIDDESDKVIGFVDVDARPCKTKIKLPRPYLSDLCVDPDFRRRGIAYRLVQACEDFTRDIPRPELWIRVKEDNVAAVQMYKSLNYAIAGKDEKESHTLIILHKALAMAD